MAADVHELDRFRRQFDDVLSQRVRPNLRAHGFRKAGRIFRRERGPLYDMIGFQADKWNGVTQHFGAFVNVGVGSADMDAVHLDHPRTDGVPVREYVLERRWERLNPALPGELMLDDATDLEQFADVLTAGLDTVVESMSALDSTTELTQWAVSNNRLQRMEKTCRYLASVADVQTLSRYARSLRDEFGNEPRWPAFAQVILEASGSVADRLVADGSVDTSA
ncbi:DUF4304 domain-containing protein [Gordonia hongkongensis]|uniref:DUF4304 domain-containing protein n=1 Tax=Gordonia hongkongensis TaxID=1701090 RepID=UPI0030CF613F